MKGSPVTSGLAAKRASFVVSGTTNKPCSGWRIAWAQMDCSIGVSRTPSQGDGCVADVGCNLGNVVERSLWRGVQNAVVAQRREPIRLAPGWTRCDWGLVPGEG